MGNGIDTMVFGSLSLYGSIDHLALISHCKLHASLLMYTCVLA